MKLLILLLCMQLGPILKDKPFQSVPKGRFILYYYANSPAQKEQDQVIADREAALARIEAFFGRRLTDPVHLLVYPTYEEAAPYPCGRTTPEEKLVHVALQPGYWAYERHNPGHELTHLLAMTTPEGKKVWCVSLLNEGLAEYLCGSPIDPHLRLTDYLQSGGKPPSRVCVDGSILYEGRDIYHLGGSFVKFLIENYPDGKAKVLALLERTRPKGPDDRPYFPDFMQSLEETFGTDYVTMMGDWNRVLEPYWAKNYEPRPEDRAQLEKLLGPIRLIRFSSYPRFLNLVAFLPDGTRALVEATPDDGWRILRRSTR